MLKVGDLVSIIDENSRARVSAILRNGKVLVEDIDGFELEYSINELIRIEEDHDHLYEKSVERTAYNKDYISKRKNPVKHKRDVVEVDLHIEELVDDHRGWSNAEILAISIRKI